MTRRDLLAMIGTIAGSSLSYQALAGMGLVDESQYSGPIQLDGAPKGQRVLVLGAGLAGAVAALELRQAGYQVQVLEYQDRIGGRCWTLRGGDRFTELGGFTQECRFDEGLYLNPGPWRIPYHHHAILDYCRRLGVKLEPFIQVNHNALVHSEKAFGGQPQRYREIHADYQGHVAELLAKVTRQGALDAEFGDEDAQMLLESLRSWGALDREFRYVAGDAASDRRGWAKPPGGGIGARPEPSEPMGIKDLLGSQLWRALAAGDEISHQAAIFQPVGGMDQIAQGFARQIHDLVTFNAKVTAIRQDDSGVTVNWIDPRGACEMRSAQADWCVCTLPLTVLGQIEVQVSAAKQRAIRAVPYWASSKVGLQFKRRFWETDAHIQGGISYTDTPIRMISYPSTDYFSGGKGVLLGAYTFGPVAFEFTALSPEERVKAALHYGRMLHPQYDAEFDNGISVGWHRVPWTLGCAGNWSQAARTEHYDNLAAIDGRIVLAGEHLSYLPAWQEGAILSSLDAIGRLHRHVVNH